MARFAYFFSQFPALTTTFIQREVRAAEKAEHELLLIGTRTPRPGTYHPHDEDLKLRTHYLSNIGITGYIGAHIRCLMRMPRCYFHTLYLCVSLNDTFRFQRIRNLIHFLAAGWVANFLHKHHFSHLHVHFAFGAASIAIFVKELCGIPFSLSIHGSDVLLPRPLTKEKLEGARFIATNCEYHIGNLLSRYPSLHQQKFHLVRIGINCNDSIWLPTPLQKPLSPLRILCVGRLLPVKAQEVLLQACALLKEWSVEFICRIAGEGPLFRILSAQISRLGLSNHVSLLGPCFEKEIIEQYEWAHVVALTSLSEGTPMTLIEAMAKGRACIAPSITAIPELVIDGVTGILFPKSSAQKCAEALQLLSCNPVLLAAMGTAGRKRAEQYFDVTVTTASLFCLLDAITPHPIKKG